MNYKIGDNIIVIYSVTRDEKYDKYINKTGVILKVDYDHYKISVDGGRYLWYDRELRLNVRALKLDRILK